MSTQLPLKCVWGKVTSRVHSVLLGSHFGSRGCYQQKAMLFKETSQGRGEELNADSALLAVATRGCQSMRLANPKTPSSAVWRIHSLPRNRDHRGVIGCMETHLTGHIVGQAALEYKGPSGFLLRWGTLPEAGGSGV